MRFLLAVLLAGVLLIPPEPCLGWGAATHLRIAQEALDAMPPEMRAELAADSTDVSEGMLYPDFTLRDLENHAWCPDGSCGSAPQKIDAEYREILSDFGGRSLTRAVAAVLLLLPAGCSSGSGDTVGPSPDQARSLSFRLGLVAHYLADLNQPYHTVKSEGAYGEEHDVFEAHVDDVVRSLNFRFDGSYTDIGDNVSGFAMNSARASHAELELISASAGAPDDALFNEVAERRFSQAVNDVVDLWYSILIRVR